MPWITRLRTTKNLKDIRFRRWCEKFDGDIAGIPSETKPKESDIKEAPESMPAEQGSEDNVQLQFKL